MRKFDDVDCLVETIVLRAEDLLPWTEVELSIGNGDHDFPTPDLPLHVSVGVVFTGAIVGISSGRSVERGETFQPLLVILVQAQFSVIDENTGGDVRGVR